MRRTFRCSARCAAPKFVTARVPRARRYHQPTHSDKSEGGDRRVSLSSKRRRCVTQRVILNDESDRRNRHMYRRINFGLLEVTRKGQQASQASYFCCRETRRFRLVTIFLFHHFETRARLAHQTAFELKEKSVGGDTLAKISEPL